LLTGRFHPLFDIIKQNLSLWIALI